MPSHVPAPSDPASPTSRRARVLRLLALSALALCALVVAGCGRGGAESPEALFARIQVLNAKGDTRAIWDLYTVEAKQKFRDDIDSFRTFLARNPVEKNRNLCREQFHVEPEVLARMDYVAIFEIENKGRERWLVDASIRSKEPAADVPGATRVYWRTALGEEHSMLTRFVDGAWYLISLKE